MKEDTTAEQWNVYKQTMNNVCKVQRPSDRPTFGVKHLGPFRSKADATRAMCDNLDDTMTDQSKCWTTLPPDGCK